MPDVSVIIPSRNEWFLAKTIESVLATARGDTEVIAVIDGEHQGPEPPKDPRVRVIRHKSPQGQRQSCNEAARISKARYILKTDAHSMFDEGFDVKLMADCEPDWIVIPRMYNLHAYDLVCDGCGWTGNNHRQVDKCPQCGRPGPLREDVVWQPKRKKRTDWMYFRSPHCKDKPMRVQYWGNRDWVCEKCGYHHDERGTDQPCQKCRHVGFRKELAYPDEFDAHRRWAKNQGPLADVMTGQGACWFLEHQRFWDLGGLDEGHGSWGQMGVEIACKAWLSGGRHVVNRKTWFAHFFRCGDGPHFPYRASGTEQKAARRYSIKLWTSGKWQHQRRPLEWIVEKFWPVPTWPKPETTPELRDVTPQPIALGSAPRPTVDKGEPTVSVIIPARNEEFLGATILDLLGHLQRFREVLVGLDGPDQTRPVEDPRVRYIESGERIGMRPMLNRLAREARGRFLLKLDAHCAVDAGMDAKLIDAWEPGSAVVPRRYDLDTTQWKRREHSHTDCRRLTHESEDGRGMRSLPWPEREAQQKGEEISETMTCSGSCWLIERRQWLDWGGHDTEHGTFGQEGAEIACKVWLSGGRLLHCKKTWYAHWNRGRSPYALGRKQKRRSEARSRKLFLDGQWPHARRSFDWLLRHFAPVPGWHTPTRTIVWISANKEAPSLLATTAAELQNAAAGIPIISVTHKPYPLGRNICVGEVGYSSHNILRQMLIGAEAATTHWVVFCESDCLYPSEHLHFCPDRDDRAYLNASITILDTADPGYIDKGNPSQCGLIANRKWAIKQLRSRLADRSTWTAAPEHGKALPASFREGHWRRFETASPIVNIRHAANMHHNWPQKKERKMSVSGWPSPSELVATLTEAKPAAPVLAGEVIASKPTNRYKFYHGYRIRTLPVAELYEHYEAYADEGKQPRDNPRGVHEFQRTFNPFIEQVLAARAPEEWTDDYLRSLPYHEYLVKHLHPDHRDPVSRWGARHVLEKMRDAIHLAQSLRDEGLHAPIDLWQREGTPMLQRGQRRVVIAHHLGIKRIVARIFASKADYNRMRAFVDRRSGGPIERAAQRQFAKQGTKSSDKYWFHNYTHLYDRFCTGRRVRRILELGVKHGASLQLWAKAFPKARIVGLDNDRRTTQRRLCRKHPEWHLYIGGQDDADLLSRITEKHGPFDLIIDDASHKCELTARSLELLWPAVAKQGLYVIEDLAGKLDDANGDDPGQDRSKPIGAFRVIETLVDDIFRNNQPGSVSYYPNIVFLEKSLCAKCPMT